MAYLLKFFEAFLFIFLPIYSGFTRACYIQGTDSGVCVSSPLDPIWRATFLPFCYNAVIYPACVPQYKTLPPTREFPDGRWFNHTIIKKDTWVGANAMAHIEVQLGYEKNKTMKNLNHDIYGHRGHVRKRFLNRPNCQMAYKRYFCWINFPRCDTFLDESLPTCKSACENFFRSCNYEFGLWRCGKSKWFNGYEPEPPQVDPVSGNLTYFREYFPGQPFRRNKYTTMGVEVPLCTPALVGSASSTRGTGILTSLVVTMFGAWAVYKYRIL